MLKDKKIDNYFLILLFASSLCGLIFLVYLHLLTFTHLVSRQETRNVIVWWVGVTFILITPPKFTGNWGWKKYFGKITTSGKISLWITGIYGITRFVFWGIQNTALAQERFFQIIFGLVFQAAMLSAWSRIKFKKK